MRSNVPFQLFAWVVLVFLGSFFVVSQEEYTEDALKAMTEEELEEICLVRGFEIMRDEIDPSTGLPYELSHEDFVEAARRCLEIEQEMNELLAEFPELAAEVEEEIKKLETEQQARKAEVEQLEEELARAEAATSSQSSTGSAFVPPSQAATHETVASASASSSTADDLEVIDDGDIIAEDSSKEHLEDNTVEEVLDTKEESLDVAAKNETAKEDYTLSAVTFEIIRAMAKQVESDVKRIIELVAPVLQPILKAGDVAWRHLKVAFQSIRRSSQNSGGGGETTEEVSVEPVLA